ncbi:MAG TPA: hypothetical protein VN600_08905 [Gemmatimonadaceae bacterium]|nr:hypothetical protein [Gemmatimonadaceae bacterium]
MTVPRLDETRERFFRAIMERVPAERIAEIHFFQPIRQGGIESGVAVVVEEGSAPRIIVHTARYRLVLKGIDRGKWEATVVAEADAPLVTVDAVVRGVQRRAGDVDEAVRMEGSEARAIAEQLTGSS